MAPSAKRRLQLRLLSRSGELVQSVECFSGQLSVFRAVVPKNLEPFERALRGIPGPERFSIQIDDADFDPSEHLFIGFGENFQHTSETVNDFIAGHGIDPNGLRSVLLPYELNDIGQRPLSSLSPCEERRLRLLLATYTPASEIIILRNPFEPLAERWREPFAELLLDTVRMQGRIVVVTGLATRPQCWIQNELVSRLQVDETAQRTIGFSNAPSDVQDMIHELRAMMKSGAIPAPNTPSASMAVPPSIPPHSSASGASARPTPDRLPSGAFGEPPTAEKLGVKEVFSQLLSPRYRRPIGLALGGAVTLVLAIVVSQGGDDSTTETASIQPPTQVASVETPAKQSVPLKAPAEPPRAQEVVPTTAVAHQAPPAIEPERPVVTTALDEYPKEVRMAVLAAFGKGPNSASRPTMRTLDFTPPAGAGAPQSEAGTNSNFVNLLNSLSSDESSPSFPDSPPSPFGLPMGNTSVGQPENDEARREQIRQKFLEAIQRAAQNQGSRPDL